MVGTSGSWLFQQQSPWESSASKNCMIAPVDHRQHEFLPASVNAFRASTANFGLNGFGFPGLPERGRMHEANGLIGKPAFHCWSPLLAPNGYAEEQTSLVPAKVDAQASTYEAPSPQQKKFVIFDRCGNETRLVFSSLCPQEQNQQDAPLASAGARRFLPGQLNKLGQTETCIKAAIPYEESGENETVDEGSEMREDTEEINALLYSDDDDDDDGDFDSNCDGEGKEDDEVSTGHSPLAKWEEQDIDEVASIDSLSKRQKALDGGYNKVPLLCTTTNGKRNGLYKNMLGEDLICSCDEEFGPTIGNKRPRKDKIRDTLRVLKSIIPDVKSKDPLVILNEAITYLKSLKSNAETMSMEEDPDSSSCYGPSN